MENLFGIILFAIVTIISIIAKKNEESKKEIQRRSAKRTPEEEIPEAVRRMLYGNRNIPTARPRTAEPEEGPARPVPVSRRPEETANPQWAQEQAMRRQLVQQAQQAQQQAMLRQQQMRQRQGSMPRPAQPASVPRQAPPVQQQRKQKGHPGIPPSPTGRTAVGQRNQQSEVRPQPVAPRQAPPRQNRPLPFRDLRQMRNAIIYSEILGKPVSLREDH